MNLKKLYLLFFINISILSCMSDMGKTHTNTILEEVKYEQEKEKFFFDFRQYEKQTDSLLLLIHSVNSSIIRDTISQDKPLFNELKNTTIENFTKDMQYGITYNFQLSSKTNLDRHSLSILTFDTTEEVDSLYSKIQNVAIEKSGVPGLTYGNDYLSKYENKLYWIHSSCSYSYENHCRLVKIFENNLNITIQESIRCKCGHVICELQETP